MPRELAASTEQKPTGDANRQQLRPVGDVCPTGTAWWGRTAYGRFSATTAMLRLHLSRILALASSPAVPLRSRHQPQMALARFAGSPARKARLRGVVFDMDGTLTVPVIDFGAMYLEVLGEETYTALRSATPHGSIDILHHIETWAPPAQQKAYEIIARFEREGLERLQIMPGAAELCGFLDAQQVKRGLITRNVKDSVDLFHALFGMEFTPALSREFRPYKPDPAPLLHICSTWNVHPSEVMMIGDSLRDDVACGKRAGAFTCLLDETGRYGSLESFGDGLKPDFKVSSLVEVHAVLETHFELTPHCQFS